MAQYSSASANTSTGRLASSLSNGDGPNTSRHSTLIVESEAASLEARRLASFPSGQPPDASSVPAIERYDWPAPASTAVMTAELSKLTWLLRWLNICTTITVRLMNTAY